MHPDPVGAGGHFGAHGAQVVGDRLVALGVGRIEVAAGDVIAGQGAGAEEEAGGGEVAGNAPVKARYCWPPGTRKWDSSGVCSTVMSRKRNQSRVRWTYGCSLSPVTVIPLSPAASAGQEKAGQVLAGASPGWRGPAQAAADAEGGQPLPSTATMPAPSWTSAARRPGCRWAGAGSGGRRSESPRRNAMARSAPAGCSCWCRNCRRRFRDGREREHRRSRSRAKRPGRA